MKVTISSTKGVVTDNAGTAPLDMQTGMKSTSQLVTTNHVTGTLPGMYVLSGSTGALGYHLPDPANFPMSEWGFRITSADAHILSSSQVSYKAMYANSGSLTGIGAQNGSKITFPAVAQSSIVLKSDGYNYLVMASSGSFTFV